MILNSTDAKLILQITSESFDDTINQILPTLNQWVLEYCGYPYDETSIEYRSTEIAFDESAGTITDASSGFASFKANNDILVSGTNDNNRIYSIKTVTTDNIMTLDTGWSLIEEALGKSTNIVRVRWKDGLKNAVAFCLGELLNPAKISGVESKSIADFSEKYTTSLSKNAFSPQAIGYLTQFRTVKWMRR